MKSRAQLQKIQGKFSCSLCSYWFFDFYMPFKFWKLFLLAQNEEKFLNFWLIKSFKPVLQILVKVFLMYWRCLRFFGFIYLQPMNLIHMPEKFGIVYIQILKILAGKSTLIACFVTVYIPVSIPGRNQSKKILPGEDFNSWFFWTL